jgi:membrane associated rhomboid family serine protease
MAMKQESQLFWLRLLFTAALIAVLWIVKGIEWWYDIDFGTLGILPQHVSGLKGILFAPFIHGSFEHLSSNTAAISLLLIVLLNAYPSIALWVLAFVHIFSGFFVWLFTTPHGYHIGISGIIYGIASFLIASGVVRKNRSSTVIAILVALLYGSMAGGFFPKEGISWQSHAWGAVSGVIIAIIFRNKDLPEENEEENENEDGHFFDTDANKNFETEKKDFT